MIAMMLCVELPDAEVDIGAGKRNLVVRIGPARTWRVVALAVLLALAIAGRSAYDLHPGWALLALVPAAVAALELIRRAYGDPRPGSMAFWGIGFYATTVTGLAIVYAVVPATR
jgi:1,4-dihydroxy-2-naphthoate octaprenyltransferase